MYKIDNKTEECFICKRKTKEFICFLCDRKIKYYQSIRGHSIYKSSDLFFTVPYFNEYKELIKRFKFNKETYLYKKISYLMVKHYLNLTRSLPDIIVPMPLGKMKEKQRGFNQCKLLALGLKEITGADIKEYLLRKDGKQLSLTFGKDRSKSIEGLMYINKKINLNEKKILVIDDIYTTGSTMRETYRVLKENGAKQIEYLFFARQEAKINIKKWF